MTGIELIAQERTRQIEVEGWDSTHDASHADGELSIAAACYAVNKLPGLSVAEYGNMDAWPWHEEWDKRRKHDRLRSLVVAGALIAAELDRLIAEGESAA